MKDILFRKKFVFGAANLLIFVAFVPAFSSSVLKTLPQGFETIDINNDGNSFIRKVIYVDDDNTAGPWDGTEQNPYQYIQQAIENATDDDRIEVREGTYKENIVVNKILEIVGEGCSSTIIDGCGNGHTMIITEVAGISISFFKICNSGSENAGIYIHSSYNEIKMNCITDNGYGIILDNSVGNEIIDNWITGNQYQGIWLDSSELNKILRNKINENGDDGIIVDSSSTFNKIYGNVVASNVDNGTIINSASRDNEFIGNKVTGNKVGIMGRGGSDSNQLYYNDFHDNTINADDSSVDIWNGVSKGNHWSDFDEEDEGAYDTNYDGIADDPYYIKGGDNKDNYPLILSPVPGKPTIEGPHSVKSGVKAEFHLSTPEGFRTYDEVYYQIYWDNGDYWETTEMVNTTIGTNETHIWTPRNNNKNYGERTYNILVRSYIKIEDFFIYSEDSEPFAVTVTPRTKNDEHIKNRGSLGIFKFPKWMDKSNFPNDCNIVVPRDYLTIQEAIDNAVDGDTICVWDGIYEEDIIIEKKNLTLKGNGSEFTIIEGQGKYDNVVTIVNSDNIDFSGFKITKGKYSGMWLDYTSGCKIHDNYFGDKNTDRLLVFYSQNTVINNNVFVKCGLGIYGNTLEHFLHTIEGNLVNDLDLLYIKNEHGIYITEEDTYGSIIVTNCSYVLIEGQKYLKDSHFGIELSYCSDVTVKESEDISSNYCGIYVYNCSDEVEISNNEIYGNEQWGIFLRKSSATISNNDIHHNSDESGSVGSGIVLWESSECHIKENNIYENGQPGIYLQYSHNNEIGRENRIHNNTNGIDLYDSTFNQIHNNTIEKNSYNGIFLKNSCNNSLLWNIIEHNALEGDKDNIHNGIEIKQNSNGNLIEYNNISFQEFWGISIYDNSNGNMIYHNIFYANGYFWKKLENLILDKHASDKCVNIWDNGYPEDYEDFEYEHGKTKECGNSYSHFLPWDKFCGPSQDKEGSDGIIDDPYEIPGGNNIERYPFSQKFLFSNDNSPPDIIPEFPRPRYLHIQSMSFPWPFRSTFIISLFQENLTFNVMADEPYNDDIEWQSNFVKVNFTLKKTSTGESYSSGEIEFNPFGGGKYKWKLPDEILIGKYELKIVAEDFVGNDDEYILAPLYIIKIP